jgi:hypothetical protein
MNQTIRIIWMLDSSMQTMFRDGFSLKTKYLAELSVAESQERLAHFNDETLSNLVTFDRFQAVLDAKLM